MHIKHKPIKIGSSIKESMWYGRLALPSLQVWHTRSYPKTGFFQQPEVFEIKFEYIGDE